MTGEVDSRWQHEKGGDIEEPHEGADDRLRLKPAHPNVPPSNTPSLT
jgi:hypothetical protein